jgi:hypothetical protein
MPDYLVGLLLGVLLGAGLGFVLGAVLAAGGVLWAKQQLDNYEARVVEKALGMVRDITQVRAATPPSLHPILDAIEAEKALFDLTRQRELQGKIGRTLDKE